MPAKSILDELRHYGTLYYSGRYPWGSGENPYQRWQDFKSSVYKLRKDGLKESDIAKGFNITTAALRNRIAYGKDDERYMLANRAKKLYDKQWRVSAIAKEMGIPESSVRSLLDPILHERAKIIGAVAYKLKEQVDNGGYLDVSKGTANHLAITDHKLTAAVQKLVDDGYTLHNIRERQVGSNKYTTFKVLAPPDTAWAEIQNNRDRIMPLNDIINKSPDGGRTFPKMEKPKSVDSSRILVRYAEDGGAEKDGMIELRKGIPDISLNNAKYAQVRIAVDGSHYMKGMAVHSDNIPRGKDIIYYTNKSKGEVSNDLEAMKRMKLTDANPFGANIKLDDELIRAQRHYVDKDGKTQLSAINVVYEEGNWNTWSKNLSSQMLSKQSPTFAKQQLDLAYNIKQEEYNEIKDLTNPVVKRRLLEAFADGVDADTAHLKAAAMPRQRTQVILPVSSLKDNEIYAPNYRNGDRVVLIRYPHGGLFEIPELVVNNKNPEAKALLGGDKKSLAALDAVAINSQVAQRLSGADFDGDTVLVIPNHNKQIQTHPPLVKLKNFDPRSEYPARPGMKVMGEKGGGQTNQKMGDISNLITDMTLKGANFDEIALAVRHSMVVIDAEKHKLDYTQSYVDHNIAALKTKYQGSPRSGASTLISKASSPKRVPEVKDYTKIDKATGELVRELTGRSYVDWQTGKVKQNLSKFPYMTIVKDAFELSSGTKMESEYATHANKLKALSNTARKELLTTPSLPYSPSAKATYVNEVASLLAQLNISKKNAPLERYAQRIANAKIKLIKQDNPLLDDDDLKKISSYELKIARQRVGASRKEIFISDKEWEAIQAGAFTNTKLTEIIGHANLDRVRQLATPRQDFAVSPGKLAQAKAMLGRGYPQAEIADHLGISVSTLMRALEP